MHTIDGKRVECKIATPKETKKMNPKKNARKITVDDADGGESRLFWKLFVGGLHKSTSEIDLQDYFSQFGELEDYVVMVDRET